MVFSEPVAHAMQSGTKKHLGLCVTPPDSRHVPGTPRRSDVGIGCCYLRRVDTSWVRHADTIRGEGFDELIGAAVVSGIEQKFEFGYKGVRWQAA